MNAIARDAIMHVHGQEPETGSGGLSKSGFFRGNPGILPVKKNAVAGIRCYIPWGNG